MACVLHGLSQREQYYRLLLVNKLTFQQQTGSKTDLNNKKTPIYKELIAIKIKTNGRDVVGNGSGSSEDQVAVPLYFGKNELPLLKKEYRNHILHKTIQEYRETNQPYRFHGVLREQQRYWYKKIVERLNNQQAALLNLRVGSGKTVIALKVVSAINLKCIVVVNRLVLLKQWAESVEKFLGRKAFILYSSDFTKNNYANLLNEYDIFVINILNIGKINGQEFWNHVGMVVIDECHLTVTEPSLTTTTIFRTTFFTRIIGHPVPAW